MSNIKTQLSNEDKQEIDNLIPIIKEFYKNDDLLNMKLKINASFDIKKKFIYESLSKIPMKDMIPLAIILKNASCYTFKKPVSNKKSDIVKQKEVLAILEEKINILTRKKNNSIDNVDIDKELEKYKYRLDLLKKEINKYDNEKHIEESNIIDYNEIALKALKILEAGSISNDDLYDNTLNDITRHKMRNKKIKAEYLFQQIKKIFCGETINEVLPKNTFTVTHKTEIVNTEYKKHNNVEYNKTKTKTKTETVSTSGLYVPPNMRNVVSEIKHDNYRQHNKDHSYNKTTTDNNWHKVERNSNKPYFENNNHKKYNDVNIKTESESINIISTESFPEFIKTHTVKKVTTGVWGQPLSDQVKKEPVIITEPEPIIEKKHISDNTKKSSTKYINYCDDTDEMYHNDIDDDYYDDYDDYNTWDDVTITDEEVFSEINNDCNVSSEEDIIVPPNQNIYGITW